MRKAEDGNWKSIGSVAANLFLSLEEKQRRAFKRECERDGIDPVPVQPKILEVSHADA